MTKAELIMVLYELLGFYVRKHHGIKDDDYKRITKALSILIDILNSDEVQL